ncbi:MAG: TIGR02710 family CRISPR-associated CARF protein [Methanobacteriota archaeon]
MKRILVLSVGGSAEPVINAIKNNDLDYVYFFCSSGHKGSEMMIDSPGDPCGDKRRLKCPECGHEYNMGNFRGEAIVFQAGLEKGRYEIVTIDDPDDLNGCYQRLLELTTSIHERFGECQVIANYTGGTKTMSVAMVLAGILTQQWDLSLNIGPRVDLIRVRSGDVPVVIDKWRIICQNQMDFLRRSLDNYQYSFVTNSISEMLSQPLERSLQKKLIEARAVCEAFDTWDKFDHDKALELLEPYGSRYYPYIIGLKKILGKSKGSGYDMVSDLLNNSERRAVQKHYDDAIARLYRAIELFAQVRLEKKFGYKTSDLKLMQLPEHLHDEYRCRMRDDKLLLGLVEDYELLLKLGDIFGKKFKQNEGRIIDAIKRRNSSISGGHGTIPLGEEDYLFVRDRLKGFIMEVSGEIGLKLEMEQLPVRDIL